jgi:hypothetical protein
MLVGIGHSGKKVKFIAGAHHRKVFGQKLKIALRQLPVVIAPVHD